MLESDCLHILWGKMQFIPAKLCYYKARLTESVYVMIICSNILSFHIKKLPLCWPSLLLDTLKWKPLYNYVCIMTNIILFQMYDPRCSGKGTRARGLHYRRNLPLPYCGSEMFRSGNNSNLWAGLAGVERPSLNESLLIDSHRLVSEL